MRRIPISVGLALAIGCGGSQSGDTSTTSTTTASGVWHARLALARVDGGALLRADEDAHRLIVGTAELDLAANGATEARLIVLSSGRVAGADVQGGERGFLIPALQQALDQRSAELDGQPLSLALAPEVPFRTLAQVVYTAGQAGVTSMRLLVRTADGVGAIPFELPRMSNSMVLGAIGENSALNDVLVGGDSDEEAGALLEQSAGVGVASSDGGSGPPGHPSGAAAAPREAEGDSSLGLSLTATASGVFIAGSGGRLAPGCSTTTVDRSPTVPSRDGRPDLQELDRCLREVKGAFPDETTVIVTADPDVPFRDVAQVMAAARGPTDSPLFPSIYLAAGVL